jgi:hypothetical protein
LRKQQVCVGISFEIEIDQQRRLLVGVASGIHVGHVRRRSLFARWAWRPNPRGSCISTGVIGFNLISGGLMFGNCAIGRVAIVIAPLIHQERDDHRHDQPIDEEFGHDSPLSVKPQ